MKKILIVEDDNTISNELKELLINSGYKAEVLEDFQNSKEKILESQADLILLDINIPGINGEILLKEIRKVSDVPIIMVTSRTEEYINDNALTVNISRLRNKLSEVGYDKAIETRKGQGYILV